jgi:actin-related protein
MEFQEELYRNIILCGGSSLFRGFLPRIEKELLNHAPNTVHRKDINFI